MYFKPQTNQITQKYSDHTRTTEGIKPGAFTPSPWLRQKSLTQARDSLAQASSLRQGKGSKRGTVALSRTLA